MKTWLITGINSGFGREMATQLLERGDRVAGTIRRLGTAEDLAETYREKLRIFDLDVTDRVAVRAVVDAAFAELGRIDVVVSNAGYGLFGAAEEVTDEQVEHQIATNLLGSIQVIRAALPHLRRQGGGRIVQMSSVAGLAAHPGASLYHASKWGVEGFVEALAGEVAPFGIGVTLVEPGGARTAFAGSSLRLGEAMSVYDGTPAAFVRAVAAGNVALPGDPAEIAARVLKSVEQSPAPLRLVLGRDSYEGVTAALRARLAQINADN
ncbi:SDR family oxidoreductase [Actinoplanes sp. CA-054009]